MSDREIQGVLLVLVCACVLCTTGGLIGGCDLGSYNERKAAIEAGVAEWTVDAKTGATSFRYVTPKGEDGK